MERPFTDVLSRKFKWKEYLMTRYAQEWKIKLERWQCPLEDEVGACIIFLFGGWGNSDSEIFRALSANFKKWWFCLFRVQAVSLHLYFSTFRFSFCSHPVLSFFNFFLSPEMFNLFEIKVASLHWESLCLFPIGNLEGNNLC